MRSPYLPWDIEKSLPCITWLLPSPHSKPDFYITFSWQNIYLTTLNREVDILKYCTTNILYNDIKYYFMIKWNRNILFGQINCNLSGNALCLIYWDVLKTLLWRICIQWTASLQHCAASVHLSDEHSQQNRQQTAWYMV